MSEPKMVSQAFTNSHEGHDLVNVKFFLGDDRNITQDQLTHAAEHFISQMRLNESVDITTIDVHLKSNKISDLI